MLFHNLNVEYSNKDFADKILVSTVNISPKTKAFLKERAIITLLDFSKFLQKEIDSISCKHIRREIQDFKMKVIIWMKKSVRKVKFSHDIPPPQKIPKGGEQKQILIALILAEPLFGNRRNTTSAKKIHLPTLYEPNCLKNQGDHTIMSHAARMAS